MCNGWLLVLYLFGAAEEFPHSDSLFRNFSELVLCQYSVFVCVCLVSARKRDKMTQRHFSELRPYDNPAVCVCDEHESRRKKMNCMNGHVK